MNSEVLCRMNFDSFHQIVSNKTLKQIHVVWLCLKRSELNPDEAPEMGICWYSHNEIMINPSILGLFLNRSPNTMNRGFRCHGFKSQKSSALIRKNIPTKFDFKSFPDPKKWILRRCEGFTKNTTEYEAIKSKYHTLVPKKHKKNQDQEDSASEQNELSNITEELNLNVGIYINEPFQSSNDINTSQIDDSNLKATHDDDDQGDLFSSFEELTEYWIRNNSCFQDDESLYSEEHMIF